VAVNCGTVLVHIPLDHAPSFQVCDEIDGEQVLELVGVNSVCHVSVFVATNISTSVSHTQANRC